MAELKPATAATAISNAGQDTDYLRDLQDPRAMSRHLLALHRHVQSHDAASPTADVSQVLRLLQLAATILQLVSRAVAANQYPTMAHIVLSRDHAGQLRGEQSGRKL